jgi:hypothetical protein
VGRLGRQPVSEIEQSLNFMEFETFAISFSNAFFTNAQEFGTMLIFFLSGRNILW